MLCSHGYEILCTCTDVYSCDVHRPKDSVAALKKRFSGAGKNFHVINLTLTVLETCVKNCGHRFHVKVAQKDFLSELVRVINPKVCLALQWLGDGIGRQSVAEVIKINGRVK